MLFDRRVKHLTDKIYKYEYMTQESSNTALVSPNLNIPELNINNIPECLFPITIVINFDLYYGTDYVSVGHALCTFKCKRGYNATYLNEIPTAFTFQGTQYSTLVNASTGNGAYTQFFAQLADGHAFSITVNSDCKLRPKLRCKWVIFVLC